MENKKILIVEDDLPTIDALAFKLNKKGISASTALNGEEAIERLKRGKYDLVLLDILLPKKNGFEVIKEIRTNGQSKNAKIIIFSNLGQEDNVEKAMKLGANGYIVKANIGINELSDKIIEELKN
ncbi:MAG: response regulator [Candidatus Paceibacterota bacterium]